MAQRYRRSRTAAFFVTSSLLGLRWKIVFLLYGLVCTSAFVASSIDMSSSTFQTSSAYFGTCWGSGGQGACADIHGFILSIRTFQIDPLSSSRDGVEGSQIDFTSWISYFREGDEISRSLYMITIFLSSFTFAYLLWCCRLVHASRIYATSATEEGASRYRSRFEHNVLL